jgi:hypothetical protein
MIATLNCNYADCYQNTQFNPHAPICIHTYTHLHADAYSEESSVEVKMQLLTAAMKLFFKRPPEMQSMLGRLLAAAVEDVSNQVAFMLYTASFSSYLHYSVFPYVESFLLLRGTAVYNVIFGVLLPQALHGRVASIKRSVCTLAAHLFYQIVMMHTCSTIYAHHFTSDATNLAASYCCVPIHRTCTTEHCCTTDCCSVTQQQPAMSSITSAVLAAVAAAVTLVLVLHLPKRETQLYKMLCSQSSTH